MTKDLLTSTRAAIEAAGIKKYQLQLNNSYWLNVGYQADCIIKWDDDNEVVWFFRVPNTVTPRDTKPLVLEMTKYDTIERFVIPVDYNEAMDLTSNLGLTLTEDVTQWVKKAASQNGLYPIQSTKRYDKDGNPVLYNGMPSIH